MRDYLSLQNLWKALLLGTVMALMSIPRIMEAGMPLGLYIPGAVLAMTLVSGAATAWGAKGGMCGLFPEWRRVALGLGIAVLLTAIATPIYALWLDPLLYAALEATGDPKVLALRFPETAAGKFAQMLWSGSFQVMFFAIAGMSFLARLTAGVRTSVAMIVIFRVAVGLYQMSEAGVTESVALFSLGSAVATACSCLLFARTGLIPAMAFAMGLNVHLFF